MKLRLQSNSIRLRLKQGEVLQLATTGLVEEEIVIGAGPGGTFRYALEAAAAATSPRARLGPNELVVEVPPEEVARWFSTAQVGIETSIAVDDRHRLQVLVEKDFACLDGTAEQNADTFPHPLAGRKC